MRLIICLVAKAQDTAALRRQITEEGRVEQQRMITVILHVFLTQRHLGIVEIVEDGLARLENGDGLAMDARGIEEKRTTRRTQKLFQVLPRAPAGDACP